jgi:hypothetical protein
MEVWAGVAPQTLVFQLYRAKNPINALCRPRCRHYLLEQERSPRIQEQVHVAGKGQIRGAQAL